MTILVKYKKQSKETNKILFEKLNNLSNLEWARWGGWFDSDGSFSYDKKYHKISCILALSDKSPVELFSKTFEATLTVNYKQNNYEKSVNKEVKARYRSLINGERALWFCQKIHPFVINKNNKLNELLKKFNINLSNNYNNMNSSEFLSWLVSFVEGDGSFTMTKKRNYPIAQITSNNNHLLNYIRQRCLNENIVSFNKVYLKQKEGLFKLSSKSNLTAFRKNGYIMQAMKKENLLNFYDKILPFMSLDRKKDKILKHIEIFNNK
jgi:hypothetical protein